MRKLKAKPLSFAQILVNTKQWYYLSSSIDWEMLTRYTTLYLKNHYVGPPRPMTTRAFKEEHYAFVKEKLLRKRKKPVELSLSVIEKIWKQHPDSANRLHAYRMIDRVINEFCPYTFFLPIGSIRELEKKIKQVLREVDDNKDYFYSVRSRLPSNRTYKFERNVFSISNKNVAMMLQISYPDIFTKTKQKFCVQENNNQGYGKRWAVPKVT